MTFDVQAVFREELARAVAAESKHFPVEDWFVSGRQVNGREAVAWWEDNGAPMAQSFITWYEASEAKVWVTPDGAPAIELPFEIMLGTVPVRGYIDIVLQVGTALVVTDVKTSAKAPANYRQLGIYACALEVMYGIRPRYGTFFMCRGMGRSEPKTYFLRPVELDRPQFSLAYLAGEFEQAERGIQAGVYPANPGEHCGRCGVAYACTEASGDRARELDPNWPGAKRG